MASHADGTQGTLRLNGTARFPGAAVRSSRAEQYARRRGDRPCPHRHPRSRRGGPRARGRARPAIRRGRAPSGLGDREQDRPARRGVPRARGRQGSGGGRRQRLRAVGRERRARSPPSARLGRADGRPRRRGPPARARRHVRCAGHPKGERLAWRTAGVERAAAEPSLPFFIEWEPGSRFPGSVDTYAGARLAGLLLEGDPVRVAAWLGRHEVPVEVRPGAPAVAAVTVRTAAGEAVLEAVR